GVADAKQWKLTPVPSSQYQGYAQFGLLPLAGGALAPGGSVAFSLSAIQVATTPGAASLQLIVYTTDQQQQQPQWQGSLGVQLTTPSTTPSITRYSITPADPQTLTTLQGQQVV